METQLPSRLDMKKTSSTSVDEPSVAAPDVVSRQQIEARAHELWIERGCPVGSPDEDWFRAEEELQRESRACAVSA